MEAFLTGSHVYGRPRPDSDLDLVIRVSQETADRIREHLSIPRGEPIILNNLHGAVNLILAETDEQYALWKVGTAQIRKSGNRPNRQQAKEVFDALRESVGIEYDGESGFRSEGAKCSPLTPKRPG